MDSEACSTTEAVGHLAERGRFGRKVIQGRLEVAKRAVPTVDGLCLIEGRKTGV